MSEADLVAENERLLGVIGRGATAWCSLEPGVAWEGDLGDAMEAAVKEIKRLRADAKLAAIQWEELRCGLGWEDEESGPFPSPEAATPPELPPTEKGPGNPAE